MKKGLFGPLLFSLYGLGLVFALAVVHFGWRYYLLPVGERPHHALHALLKPGGVYGHGLGILGSSMVLLLFLYSARKRELFGLHFGRMSRWLNIHIFFGIMGPILITLHTAMKFNGIVSISYFCMMAVMFSGIFGRYIYKQIPRTPDGAALTSEQIAAVDQQITRRLIEEYGIPPQTLQEIHQLSGAPLAQGHAGASAFFSLLWNDCKRPLRRRKLKRLVAKNAPHMPPKALQYLLYLTTQKAMLARRRAFLDTAHRIFHYWHVIHKPFAYVMVIIMFLHIAIVILFGYTWIF